MLVSLFQLSTSQSLVQLETLEIASCDGLKKIVDETRDEESIQEEIDDGTKSHGSMFPKLKHLSIIGCPLLEYIFPFLSAQGLPELETIYISYCNGLKYIFCQYQYVDLGSLRQLELRYLPNFIDIFQEDNHPNPMSSSCVRGSSSTSKAEKELEPIKCNIFSWTRMCCHGDQPPQEYNSESKSFCFEKCERPQCLSKIMCNIKEIELANVGKIKSIFVPMLLETLKIRGCNELKIIDTGVHDTGGNKRGNVFPKLKLVKIEDCEQMEYIFGNYTDDNQHNTKIHLQFPALEHVFLRNLPSLVDMCPKQYHTTFSVLAHLQLYECSQVANKSITHFITNHSVARSLDGTIIKELSVNMVEHFLALKELVIKNSKVESIFCLNEVNKHKMNLGLQDIDLFNLPMMTCLFVGPKNSYALKNLDMLKIVKCEKLEIVFSTAIVRCLPQLRSLIIKECKELKHIIKDDVENEKGSNNLSSRTSFPMLDSLDIINCNKLKCVFPISESKELPMLRSLMIKEADELEEIFKSEGDDQKVEIPNLNVVAFVNLPSLFQTQGIHFQAVENRFVQNCQKFSVDMMISNTDHIDFSSDYEVDEEFQNLNQPLRLESKSNDTENDNPSSETTEDFAAEIEVQATSGHELTSSQELINEQSLDPQQSLGEIDTTIKHSQANNCLKGTDDQSIQEGSQEKTQTKNKVSINDDVVMKGSSNIEEQFPNDDEIIVSKSKPSPNITSPIASQFPSIPSKDFDLYLHMESVYQQFQAKSRGHDNGNENPNAQTTKEFAAWVEAEAASRNALTYSKLEGSTSENTAATLSTISEIKNEPPIKLDVALKQKGNNISFEEGTTSTCDKPITSSTDLEVGDGKICIPSSSIVNIKLPATKYVDIGDSQETNVKDINKLIEEDPLLALEKLLNGQVSISSIRILLQDLKTLMDSSPDLDHLVSNQESKSKLISLFHALNQHQGLLPSDMKEFVEKVHNFFNENIIKYATSEQVLKKHKQLLDSKTDLINKLWSAKSTQNNLDGESSTVNAQIHELSLQLDELRKKSADLENQIDDLKSVLNKCDVKKNKLKAECTEWAQQSEELLSALASSEGDIREVEHARNLATEDFANLKSSFPTF